MVGSVSFVYFCKSVVSAVQGHARSLILAPIESAYATSIRHDGTVPIASREKSADILFSHAE